MRNPKNKCKGIKPQIPLYILILDKYIDLASFSTWADLRPRGTLLWRFHRKERRLGNNLHCSKIMINMIKSTADSGVACFNRICISFRWQERVSINFCHGVWQPSQRNANFNQSNLSWNHATSPKVTQLLIKYSNLFSVNATSPQAMHSTFYHYPIKINNNNYLHQPGSHYLIY